LNCPNCGKEITNSDAIFCPFCSKPIKTQKKHGGLITASGILAIIASCWALFLGILCLSNTSWVYYGEFIYPVAGVFGIVGFAFGLAGGILTLKRKVFPLAVIGLLLVLVAGIVMSAVGYSLPFLALPIHIMMILSIVFIAISKSDFT
jgi:hypothetical protein